MLDLAPRLDTDAPEITRTQLAGAATSEIHWEHATPYAGPDGDVTLRQSSARKRRGDGTTADDTKVMQEVHRLRKLLKFHHRGDLREKPLDIVKHGIKDSEWHLEWEEEYETALARVRASLLKNPVRYLQQLPGNPDPFLYDPTLDKSGHHAFPGRCREPHKVRGHSSTLG